MFVANRLLSSEWRMFTVHRAESSSRWNAENKRSTSLSISRRSRR